MSSVAPITHKRVLSIAGPIVLSNATVPILGAVDTGVVGQMGEAAPIGAVGLGAIILASVYWLFGFLRMGTTGLVAQAHGRGDATEVSVLLTRAFMIAMLAGGALVALQLPILWGGFQLAPASPEVESMARDYVRIRIWSAPAAIALFGFTGWLIALERTKAVLVLQLWMNGLNIALDLWFVLGLGWGVEGVAIATVIAEVTGAGLALYLCRSAFGSAAWRQWSAVFDYTRLLHMAHVNFDILLRSVLLLMVMISFTFIGAGFGDVTLAANHILLQFIEITAYALDGFAFAVEAIAGQAIGARSRKALRRGAGFAALWGGVSAVVLALNFALLGGMIIDVMTTADDVRLEARRYLPWMVLAPLLGLAAWMLDGVFIGATRTRDMRNMMLISSALYALAAVVFVQVWGAHGLWAALMISYIARGVSLAWKYPALERDLTLP